MSNLEYSVLYLPLEEHKRLVMKSFVSLPLRRKMTPYALATTRIEMDSE